ncbi:MULTISPECIES: hypothetical protein [Bradyrhizobium]|uniref:hypothetical protein n=1 Tax=Bradyrhizobium TaxID=374 RepID=UPI00155E5349|nr:MULTISPECIES: hypothetical protein [Bradyrhizobium]MBR1167091.1 hypothetical protein [Bradyrhizobium liaoningense]
MNVVSKERDPQRYRSLRCLTNDAPPLALSVDRRVDQDLGMWHFDHAAAAIGI